MTDSTSVLADGARAQNQVGQTLTGGGRPASALDRLGPDATFSKTDIVGNGFAFGNTIVDFPHSEGPMIAET